MYAQYNNIFREQYSDLQRILFILNGFEKGIRTLEKYYIQNTYWNILTAIIGHRTLCGVL